MSVDAAQEQEWLRQNNLIYSGLIGIGVVMLQPFLTAGSLDLSAKICVVGFWHVTWIAGVGMLASGLTAVAVYSADYWRLEREEPGDTGS